MRGLFKFTFVFFIACGAFSISTCYFWRRMQLGQVENPHGQALQATPEEFARLQGEAASIKKFAAANHYNLKVCFLADMKMPSGKKRFFVYDLQKDSIILSGLVAHGSCDNGFQQIANFSNKVNSGCSCLGKFRIGSSYAGRFGKAYKLYGLDSSNNNTFERSVVLHSYECVPEMEVYPSHLCNSRGCPMVAPGFLQKLGTYIKSSYRPVLMKIFN